MKVFCIVMSYVFVASEAAEKFTTGLTKSSLRGNFLQRCTEPSQLFVVREEPKGAELAAECRPLREICGRRVRLREDMSVPDSASSCGDEDHFSFARQIARSSFAFAPRVGCVLLEVEESSEKDLDMDCRTEPWSSRGVCPFLVGATTTTRGRVLVFPETPSLPKVQTRHGRKRMEEVGVGEKVLVLAESGFVFSPVLWFLHRDANATLHDYLHESGKGLVVSKEHLLAQVGCPHGPVPRHAAALTSQLEQRFLRAGRLAESAADVCLLVRGSAETPLALDRVTSVRLAPARGLFAPVTQEGTIVVNGVLAAVFTHLESFWLQKTLFRPLNFAMSLLGDSSGQVPFVATLLESLGRLVMPLSS